METKTGTGHPLVVRRWQRYIALWSGAPRRIRIFVLGTAILFALAAGYVYWLYSGLWAVEVDGHVVAVTSNRASIQSMISDIVHNAAQSYGRDITVYSQVAFRPVTREQARELDQALYIQDAANASTPASSSRSGASATAHGGPASADVTPGRTYAGSSAVGGGLVGLAAGSSSVTSLVEDPNVVRQRLSQALKLGTKAAAIVIAGQPVVYVDTVAVGQQVLDKILADYKARYGDSGTNWQDVHFAENPTVQAMDAPIDQIKSPQDAENILLRGTDEIRNYTVQKGDSLWLIASRNNMSVAKLEQANPQLQNETLQIGQVLNLVVARPYLTVLSTEQKTYTRSVPFPVQVQQDPNRWPWEHVVEQKGTPGKEQVTEIIARKNGQIVGQEISQVVRLQDPTVQIELTGTRQVPKLGSGEFVWPLAVPGVITSPFGYRSWRYSSEFHTGVDIATPMGTQVRAVDAGMVIFAGRDGNYGNLVRIDHGDGVVTFYAHLSRILVHVGDTVKQGQVIALSGDSGRSTGPHLHFEVRVNDDPVNPLKYYPSGG